MIEVPAKFKDTNLQNITDSQIEEIVDDINSRGHRINLMIQCTPESFKALRRMFNCQRCGNCCQTDGRLPDADVNSGIILLPEEVTVLADCLKITKSKFKREYTILSNDKYPVRRLMKYPCPFYDKSKGCSVYIERPAACRAFPIGSRTPDRDCFPELKDIQMLDIDSSCPAGRALAIAMIKQGITRRRGA